MFVPGAVSEVMLHEELQLVAGAATGLIAQTGVDNRYAINELIERMNGVPPSLAWFAQKTLMHARVVLEEELLKAGAAWVVGAYAGTIFGISEYASYVKNFGRTRLEHTGERLPAFFVHSLGAYTSFRTRCLTHFTWNMAAEIAQRMSITARVNGYRPGRFFDRALADLALLIARGDATKASEHLTKRFAAWQAENVAVVAGTSGWTVAAVFIALVLAAKAGHLALATPPIPSRPIGEFPMLPLQQGLPLGTAYTPLCVRWCPLKPLRADAKLKIRESRLQEECRPGRGYASNGPHISTHVPVCFRGCAHNEVAACTSRMGGYPAVFKDKSQYEAQCADIDREVERCFRQVYAQISAVFAIQPVPLLTHEDWAGRFPLKKAQMLLSAWQENAVKIDNRYKCMVKKEKSVFNEEECCFIHAAEEGQVFASPLKLDPRGVSVPDEAARVHTGPWCSWLNKQLHYGLADYIHYVPGESPQEFSRWFETATLEVASDAWPYLLAVQGDDSLMVYKDTTGTLQYLSSDFSRYDMSQRVSHFTAVWELWDLLGLSPPKAVGSFIKDQQGVPTAENPRPRGRIYRLSCGKLELMGSMASGDGVTITFNSLTLIMAMLQFLATDRNVEKFKPLMATLGFSVTYTNGSMNTPLRLDFLQSRPWLAETGERIFGPKPGRILARFFWIPRHYADPEKYKREAEQMARGLLSIANHVPVINDLCRRILRLGGLSEAPRFDIIFAPYGSGANEVAARTDQIVVPSDLLFMRDRERWAGVPIDSQAAEEARCVAIHTQKENAKPVVMEWTPQIAGLLGRGYSGRNVAVYLPSVAKMKRNLEKAALLGPKRFMPTHAAIVAEWNRYEVLGRTVGFTSSLYSRGKDYEVEELKEWRSGAGLQEHVDSEHEFGSFYELDAGTVERLRIRCSEWVYGELLDNTPELTTAVAKIATADLQ